MDFFFLLPLQLQMCNCSFHPWNLWFTKFGFIFFDSPFASISRFHKLIHFMRTIAHADWTCVIISFLLLFCFVLYCGQTHPNHTLIVLIFLSHFIIDESWNENFCVKCCEILLMEHDHWFEWIGRRSLSLSLSSKSELVWMWYEWILLSQSLLPSSQTYSGTAIISVCSTPSFFL